MMLHRTKLRFTVAFGAIILVGFGSVAFHASLKRESQWADEVPMLYSVSKLS